LKSDDEGEGARETAAAKNAKAHDAGAHSNVDISSFTFASKQHKPCS